MLTEKNLNLLPYFFTDPVYVVKEKHALETVEETENAQEAAAMSPEKAAANPKAISYEGKNLKKILILFKNEKMEKLPESSQVFLGKILQAVGLGFEDVALVNIDFIRQADYDQLNHFDAHLWLSFGIAHEALLIKDNFPFYEVKKTKSTTLLLANSLEEIESTKDKKVLLWNSLKKLFP